MATLSSLLSVLVVTYNSKPFLTTLFASMERHAPEAQVVVVDNASSDDSSGEVARLWPKARLIRKRENLGFASGNNLAALHADRPFLLLLNADTVLLQDLDSTLEFLQGRPTVGIVGGRMLGHDLEYRRSCGQFPWGLRLAVFSRLHRQDGPFRDGSFPDDSEPVQVDWVEGSFLLTRRELWDSLGGLDTRYFMYVEDVDYCKRALDAGYTTHYMPGLTYQHFGGYTNSRLSMLVKGYRTFNDRHASRLGRLVAHAVLDMGLLARLGVSGLRAAARNPEHAAKAKACLQALLRR